MKTPYPIICAKQPFLYVTVTGIDLTTVVGTGTTELQVYRVQKTDVPTGVVHFVPLEQKKNKFTFAFDNTLFDLDGGRFQADLYYLGVLISSTYFVYDKPKANVMGSTHV